MSIDKKRPLLPLIEQKAIEVYRGGFEIPYKHDVGEKGNIFLSGATWGYNTSRSYINSLQGQINEQEAEIIKYRDLLEREIMKQAGGSLSNKTDHWFEYCKENNIAP